MDKSERRIAKLIKKADGGDVGAMLEYCSLFSERERMESDRESRRRFVRYLKEGARRGDAAMLCNLGAEYYGGGLLKRDFAKALHYYELSAANGCVQALSNLGYCYYYGRSIPVDYHKAYECFLKAYLLEGRFMPETCYKLGDCFRHGRGVSQDPLLARRLYEEAYDNAWRPTVSSFKSIDVSWSRRLMGADAAARLGDCYRLGIGGSADLKQAAKYYRIAAAGFKRKIEFGDCFAPALLDGVRNRLREIAAERSGKRRRRNQRFALTTDVAGLRYADDWERLFRKLKVGTKVLLLRDPGNAYDANAIAVMTEGGERFGWVPRSVNATPAMLLDRGGELRAEITDKGKRDGVCYVTILVGSAS